MGTRPEAIKSAFGKRLRVARQKEGISQEALALRAGLDRTYIGSAERGQRNISLVNIVRIARALRIPASELLGTFDEQ
jgi:transcriptional regulator with XRE-family HTH domain